MAGYDLRMTDMGSHTFMFTNVSTSARKDLITKLKHLGGSSVDSNIFEKSISHLVCGSLKKTEKFFGACISGKWIISPQFIIDSFEVGMWLEEENYLFRVENQDPLKDLLAMAARRWRIQVHDYKLVPFTEWRVTLLMTVEKATVFKRLLKLGGAEILRLSVPFSNCSKIRLITHVFVDDLHSKYVPELQELGCLCLKEQFLGDYILEDPPPDPFDFIPDKSSVEFPPDCSLASQPQTSERGRRQANRQKSSNCSSKKVNNSSTESPCTSQSSSFILPSTKQEAAPNQFTIQNVKNPSTSHAPINHSTKIPHNLSSTSSSPYKGVKTENVSHKSDSINRQEDKKDGLSMKAVVVLECIDLTSVETDYLVEGDGGKASDKNSISKGGSVSMENSKVRSGDIHKRKANVLDMSKIKNLKMENLEIESSTSNDASFVNNSSSSSQLNPVSGLKQVQQTWTIRAQENDKACVTNPSRKSKKSQSALEYLDPNLPSLHSSSTSQHFTNQKPKKPVTASSQSFVANPNTDTKSVSRLAASPDHIVTNQLDSKFDTMCHSSNQSMSSRLVSYERNKDSISSFGSAKKRKPDSSKSTLMSTPQKRQRSGKDCSDLNVYGGSNMCLSVNIYLNNPKTTPMSNGVKISNMDCKDNYLQGEVESEPICANESEEGHSSHSNTINHTLAVSPQKHENLDHKSHLSQISSEHTPTKLNGDVIEVNPAYSKAGGQISSVGEKYDKSVFKTPDKIAKNGLPSSSNKLRSSPALPPNIYLYGLSPNKNVPVNKHISPSTQNSASKSPISKKVVTKQLTPSSQKSTKSTPSKKSASKDKGKSTQCVLQRFGFKSTNKSKDGLNSPQGLVLMKPKIEPESPCQDKKDVPTHKSKCKLIIDADNSHGEIIVISDDEVDNRYSSKTESTKQSDVDEDKVHNCKQHDKVNVSTENADGMQPKEYDSKRNVLDPSLKKENNSEHEMNIAKLTAQSNSSTGLADNSGQFNNTSKYDSQSEKNVIASSSKIRDRNLFTDLSQYLSSDSDSCNVLQNGKESADNVDSKEDDVATRSGIDNVENDDNFPVKIKEADRMSLHAKRQLFQSYGSNEDVNHANNNGDNKKDLCTFVEGSDKSMIQDDLSINLSHTAGVSNPSMTQQDQFKHRTGSSSSHHVDSGEECSDGMDNFDIPHVIWPSSFYSHRVTTTDEIQFVPAIISQCMESSRENGFYSVALEHGKPALARAPNVDLLSQFVHLLSCDDVIVKNQAFSDLMCWVQNHPPTTASTIKVYSDLFELSSDQTILCDLLERLLRVHDSGGTLSLLEFTSSVFEIDFTLCLQSRDRKTMKDCMLIKWMWSYSHAIHYNRKTKQLLSAFESLLSWPQSTPSAIQSMCTLISMVAECFRLSSVQWHTQTRTFLSDTVSSFASDTAEVIRNTCCDEDPTIVMSHLLSLKPHWFRALVTASLLSFSNDYLLDKRIQVRDISLHSIVTQYFFLLPPLSGHGNYVNKGQKSAAVLSLSSQHQDDNDVADEDNDDNSSLQPKTNRINSDKFDVMKDKNLTASKVNKVNGKGESALHIAAMKGDAGTMKRLLSVPGINVNLKDFNGWTPLHEACNHGRYTCVELLLKYVPPKSLTFFFQKREGISSKVDIDALGPERITPLHDAVLNNKVEVCKLLMKYGGSQILETKTTRNFTALDLASTEEMRHVLTSELNNDHHQSFISSLSQDSQSEDSFSLSQSEFVCSSRGSCIIFPPEYKYEQVLNVDDTDDHLSASHTSCSTFVSLITLLVNSYLEANLIWTQSKPKSAGGDHPIRGKVNLLQSNEKAVFRRMKFHMRLFKKHLKKITTPDTYVRLQAQLLMLSAAIGSHMSNC